jgi:hypothetical protein
VDEPKCTNYSGFSKELFEETSIKMQETGGISGVSPRNPDEKTQKRYPH